MIKGDHHVGDIGGHFETTRDASQGDDDAFVVSELHTANPADQRAARAHHAVVSRKVAELVDVVGAPDQLVYRDTGREPDTQTLDREWVEAMTKTQSPAAARSVRVAIR